MVEGMLDTVGPVPVTASHKKAKIFSNFSFAPSTLSSHRNRVSISATASAVVLFCWDLEERRERWKGRKGGKKEKVERRKRKRSIRKRKEKLELSDICYL